MVKANPEEHKSLPISQPVLHFLHQTILGYLYGQQNKEIQTIYSQLSISDIFQKQKKTLIFDLDETLVTCQISPSKAHHSFTLKLNGEIQKVHIAIRPFAKKMLEKLSKCYQIILFTASQLEYASKVASYLDPEKKIFTYILDREFCYQTHEGVYIKDISLFKDLDLGSTLIIDNSSLSYCFQPRNGVPILEWKGEENDLELQVLGQYLEELCAGDKIVERHQEAFSVDLFLKLFRTINF